MKVLHLVPLILYCCYLALSVSTSLQPWHFSSLTPLLVVSALTFLLMYEPFINGLIWLCPCSYILSIMDCPLSPVSFFHRQFLGYFLCRYPLQTDEESAYSLLLLSETCKPAQITTFAERCLSKKKKIILLIQDNKLHSFALIHCCGEFNLISLHHSALFSLLCIGLCTS